MDWGAWAARASIRWRPVFPGCELKGGDCAGGVWRRIGRRRGGAWLHEAWFCAPRCLERGLRRQFAQALLPSFPRAHGPHRIPLGLLILSRGHLSALQLNAALEAQSAHGHGQIGYWLEKLGFATEAQITSALALQWACPVFPSAAAGDERCASMLPFRLLEKFRMLPVRFVPSSRILYVAFSQGVDYPALLAVERILDCRTEACLITQSSLDDVLERAGHHHRPDEILFEGLQTAEEMADVTSGYALQLGAREVRIASCREFIWVRLTSPPHHTHLLFRPNPVLREINSHPTSSPRRRFGPAAERAEQFAQS